MLFTHRCTVVREQDCVEIKMPPGTSTALLSVSCTSASIPSQDAPSTKVPNNISANVPPTTSASAFPTTSASAFPTTSAIAKVLCPGQFVALKMKKYEDEEPQIGHVIVKDENAITIEWWVGSYTSIWVPWKIRGVQQLEETTTDSVLWPVTLNKSNRIPKELINSLKALYSNCMYV